MSFSVRVLLIAAALLGQVGCGYFVSGTWVDELRDQLFSKNKLRMLSSEEAAKEKASHFGKPPIRAS